MSSHIETLNTFTLENIPDLDVAVLGALELFQKESLPKIDVSMYQRPLVVGSGGSETTARIIFEKYDAVFASESTYEEKLREIDTIDGVVLVSASGGKHAPGIARTAKEHGKHVTLITNTPGAPAGEELDHQHSYDEFVFPKNREPYTYNTSTYMGMIMGYTQEDPEQIETYIKEHIDVLSMPDFARYEKFYLIVPSEFSGLIRLFNLKFIELFSRKIARDIETNEYVPHATTVVPSDELFITFGEPNTTWGEEAQRLNVPLPENANYGAMMAIGYYVIGQIQKAHPPHFKQNIVRYTEEVSKVFGQKIKPIVE